ncbi:hypothetical protein BGZ65_001974 [Modicella reniformis]|uniref:Uncharacterized protein n=1 Tax=Modicella reniformis TaxID=1440133 RepID=A0A9P6LSY0_9FUNG|nr:hypothetical protein BGZ65_001974 [Modicella reniformis]
MSLFKSSKNKSASVATSPSATPRASMQDQRPASANKMTLEQALEILLRKTVADAASEGTQLLQIDALERVDNHNSLLDFVRRQSFSKVMMITPLIRYSSYTETVFSAFGDIESGDNLD